MNGFCKNLSIVSKQIHKIYKLSVTCFMELNNCGPINAKVRWKLQITIIGFFPLYRQKNNHLSALPWLMHEKSIIGFSRNWFQLETMSLHVIQWEINKNKKNYVQDRGKRLIKLLLIHKFLEILLRLVLNSYVMKSNKIWVNGRRNEPWYFLDREQRGTRGQKKNRDGK